MSQWEVSGVNPDGFYVIRDGMGRKVATAFGKTDADVVAAAPELLADLQEHLEWSEESYRDIEKRYGGTKENQQNLALARERLDKTAALIRRAKGEAANGP